jgi:hypothetical protein
LLNSKDQASSNAKWHNNSYGLGHKVTTLFETSFKKPMTTKNNKLTTSNLTHTTIKLEPRKDLKNARKKERKKQLT